MTTTIRPPLPLEWALDNMIVALFWGIVWVFRKRILLSNTSWIMILLFLSYHAVGSYFVYEYMPLGYWLRDVMGLERNPCDRIAHFLFGLWIGVPILEHIIRATSLTGSVSSSLFMVCVVGAGSAIYEIFEAVVVELVNPEAGSAFLGAQGDPWDAQADIGAGILGSMILMGIVVRWRVDKRLTASL